MHQESLTVLTHRIWVHSKLNLAIKALAVRFSNGSLYSEFSNVFPAAFKIHLGVENFEYYSVAIKIFLDSWTPWSSYSDCSATCGSGQSVRTRRCASADGVDAPNLSSCPDPLNLGAFQSRPCNPGPCCEYHDVLTCHHRWTCRSEFKTGGNHLHVNSFSCDFSFNMAVI